MTSQIYLNGEGVWHNEDNFYVFKYKHRAGFALIPASNTELATLRAWNYDNDLTFWGTVEDYINLIKRGKLWDTLKQQDADNTEEVG